MKKEHLSNIFWLNFAILFTSTSGIFARSIELPAPILILLRSIIAAGLLFAFCKWKGINMVFKRQDRLSIITSGILLGLHWVSYFHSLKLSNVAIGMLSLFTFPIMTVFLEPLILRTRFEKAHILLGIMVFVGVYFLVPDFDISNTHTKAVAWGLFSALCYSLRNLISKVKISEYNGSAIMFSQLVIISIMLMPILFLTEYPSLTSQWPATLLLAILTTAIGHTLFLYSLKNFSATATSIMASTQPVYGILMGMLFLREFPAVNTFIGGIIILATVVIESVRTGRKQVPE